MGYFNDLRDVPPTVCACGNVGGFVVVAQATSMEPERSPRRSVAGIDI